MNDHILYYPWACPHPELVIITVWALDEERLTDNIRHDHSLPCSMCVCVCVCVCVQTVMSAFTPLEFIIYKPHDRYWQTLITLDQTLIHLRICVVSVRKYWSVRIKWPLFAVWNCSVSFEIKWIVQPKIKICWFRRVFLHQVWRNVSLHQCLSNGCSAVNGCRQNESLIKTSQQSTPLQSIS